MIWQKAIWQLPVAGTTLSGISALVGWVIFNWFNLLNCWEIVVEWNYDDINGVQLDTYNAPRIDGGWVLWYYINWKTITFNMVIKETDETWLNTKIDLLKKNLAVKEWLLEIVINWEKREWKANLTSFTVNRDFTKKTIQNNIQIMFALTNHMYASKGSAVSELWVTSNNLDLDIDNYWTTSCFYKTVVIFWNGNIAVDNVQILKDWYVLEINNSFSDGDILIIDWVNKVVTLNWSQIDFNWPFTELNTWSNPMQINTTGTLNVDITILFNVNYL
jgi:hypothetical protein